MNVNIGIWASILAIDIFLIPAASAMARIVVVGNPQQEVRLTEEQVTRIFLGKMRSFPNGEPVKALDQQEGRLPRQEFLAKVLHKSEPALKSYWSNLVFTGNGTPPDTLSDDEAVKKYISANPNAIGYIESDSVDKTVKVLMPVD